MDFLVAEHAFSISEACRAMRMERSGYYRRKLDPLVRDGEVIEALQALIAKHARWGFWKCYGRLKLLGKPWNHKRVYRIYLALGLNQRRRTKKRLPARAKQSMEVVPMANQTWSVDFMSDALYSGRRFRALTVLDEGVREGLGIEIDTSLPAVRVIRALEQITGWRGFPKAIRCDNGPELISQEFADWCCAHHITLRYIQPGKPNQNAFIERFNRTYREEVLDLYLFENLDEVREISYEWLCQYNEQRPHDALGGLPPSVYRQVVETKTSTSELSV